MSNISKAIKIFRKKKKYTNCYVNYNKFLELIKHEKLFILNECIFILKKVNGVYKFLYFVDDLIEIKKFEKYLCLIDIPVILELVSKNKVDLSAYESVGFFKYKVYSRYSVKNNDLIDKKRKTNRVLLAQRNDASQVHNIAQDVFDPICDFIPTIEEVESFILRKECYVIKKEDEVLGFALYVHETYGYDIRLNCVNPKYQSGFIGYSFINSLPPDGMKYLCWIDNENTPSSRIMITFGFKPDGLKNHIFIYNN